MTNSILKYLNNLPRCKAEKRHGGIYGTSGRPDITGCIDGVRIEIEVKTGTNKPTKLQEKEIEAWKAAGACACVVWSLDEAKEFLRENDLMGDL